MCVCVVCCLNRRKEDDKQECYGKFRLSLRFCLNFTLEGENNVSHKPFSQFFLREYNN